jgi:hypothetical protein
MYGQDTVPLHRENLSVMNKQNKTFIEMTPPVDSSNGEVEKNKMTYKLEKISGTIHV